MNVSKPRLLFNISLLLLLLVLFLMTYPTSYSSLLMVIFIAGIYHTVAFFIRDKNKKAKWSLFAVFFVVLFLAILLMGI